MAITYHSGRRIQGTQADFDGTPAVSGGWKEIARTTLGSTNSNIDVASLADKRYYMILTNTLGHSTAIDPSFRLNADSGSNYATRYSHNGGTDGTLTSQSLGRIGIGTLSLNPSLNVTYIANLSGKEKLLNSHMIDQNTAGAGNSPNRTEVVNKWSNTSNPIDEFDVYTGSATTWTSGSECVVLGYDPDDTHTDNFWEELDTTTISSAGELDTGSFTAKKYLWIQYSCNSTDGGFGFRFNSDTGTNYARRFSQNGASDQTELSYNMMRMIWSGANTYYGNMFIINNSANEKLVINHQAGITATGAGTAPYRWETAGKWANTSSQITSVQFLDHADASGFIDSGTVKVWGSN